MQKYECRIGRIKMGITIHRILATMAHTSIKLYNTALWHSRKQWEKTGKIPCEFDLWNTIFPENGIIKQIEVVPRKDYFEKEEGQVKVCSEPRLAQPLVHRWDNHNWAII